MPATHQVKEVGVNERFDDYVERCLYDPEHGFYRTGGSAGGRSGDFLTSPEVGPLFSEVLGRALDQWWEDLGRPDPYRIYDAGSGPGTLARQLSAADGPSAAARIVLGFDQADALPDELDGAVIVANEVLDNIPFRIMERTDHGWSELHVGRDERGRNREVLQSLDRVADRAVVARIEAIVGMNDLPIGARVPLLERACHWIELLLDRAPAAVVAFDYGTMTTGELARRGGWLRTYRSHERGHDPLVDPGRWDITTDVAIDQLRVPTEVTTQAEFLRRWGIDELVTEGRAYWSAHAARPDVAAMKMRSRVGEAEALLDPDGLGGWLVATWRRS